MRLSDARRRGLEPPRKSSRHLLKRRYLSNADTGFSCFQISFEHTDTSGLFVIHPKWTVSRILFLHIVTTLLVPPLTLSLSRATEGVSRQQPRPPWNFLIRQIRIRLFADATAASSPGGSPTTHRRDNGSKDHTTIGCTVFPLDPGCRALARRETIRWKWIEWRGDVGVQGRAQTRNCVSLTFLDSSVHFSRFPLFLHKKIRMSRLPVAARTRRKERQKEKKTRSANSICSHVARGRRRQLHD